MKRFFNLVKVQKGYISSTATKRWNKMSSIRSKRLANILSRLRWFHIPITFVFTLVLLGQIRRYRIRRYPENDKSYKPLPLEISVYKMLPLRTISRLWGWVNSIELPETFRQPILKSYATAFGCDLDEAVQQDLTQYKNLNEFFRRELKPGLRPIAGSQNDIVSPCDGTILHMGSAKDGQLEQVKGMTYTLESFLGPITWKPKPEPGQDYQQSLLQNPENELYHCVIYLAPGDYHRFHSPVNWTVRYRRHFPGKLYSVRPTFASWFPNLFAVNERAAYFGDWKYGFFAMVPVGAVNVGSIKIYFDEKLRTNRTQMLPTTAHYEDAQLDPVRLRKGDPFGEFNLGSTIVLIFEAPKNMRFKIKQGMKIKYGQLVGKT